jgi:biopolymer transport protein ExbD
MNLPDAPAPVSNINVTPMVDVMLVLLIIFMVVTPMLSKGVSVDMVKAKNAMSMAGADKTDAIVIAVTRDDKVFLGATREDVDHIAPKVRDLLANRADKTVYVKADQRSRYAKVVDLVNNLRAAGVDQLGLLTGEIDQKKPPRPATVQAGAPARPPRKVAPVR